MSVETGPSGAVAAGPAIAGAVPVIGPSIGIVNEGPVGPGFRLENTMLHKIGEITFDRPVAATVAPEASKIAIPEVFLRAFESAPKAAILQHSEVREILPKALLATKIVSIFASPNLLQPEAYKIPQVVSAPQAEVRVKEAESTQPVHAGASLPETHHAQEVEIMEEVIKIGRGPKSVDDTGEEETRRKIVLVKDKPTLERRIEAVKKAFKMALKTLRLGEKVAGPDISKALDQSDPALLSGIAQPFGPDGSLEDDIKELSRATFSTEDEAVHIVLKHTPVKEGTPEEERATKQEVDNVTRYRLVKPAPAVEIVQKRLIRKTKQAPAVDTPLIFGFGEEIKPKVESTLEDSPELAAVFQKAA